MGMPVKEDIVNIKVSKQPLELSDLIVCSHDAVNIGVRVFVMLKKEDEIPFKDFNLWLCLDTWRNQSEDFFRGNDGLVYGKEEDLDGFYGWTYSGLAVPDQGGEPDEELVEDSKFLLDGKVLQTIHPVNDPNLRTVYASQASAFADRLKAEQPNVIENFFNREYWVKTLRVPPLGDYANLGVSMDVYNHVRKNDRLHDNYLEWKKNQQK